MIAEWHRNTTPTFRGRGLGYGLMAFRNRSEFETQPSTSSAAKSEASWLLRGNPCPIGSKNLACPAPVQHIVRRRVLLPIVQGRTQSFHGLLRESARESIFRVKSRQSCSVSISSSHVIRFIVSG